MNDCEIVTTRLLDAPRERVFQAFSDPAILARWWGPAGFTNTFKAFDFEPGGIWRFVMHGPDGVDYPNESVFAEIVKPERIVFHHISGHKFSAVFLLREEQGKTLLHWTMRFDSADECARVRNFVIDANGENMDRLERQLGRLHGKPEASPA